MFNIIRAISHTLYILDDTMRSIPRYQLISGCGDPENRMRNRIGFPSGLTMSIKESWITGFSRTEKKDKNLQLFM